MSNGASVGSFFSFLLIAHISWTSLDPLQLYISPCSLSTSPPLLPPGSIPVSFIATRSKPRRENGLRCSTHSGSPREETIPLLCFGRQRKQTPPHYDAEALVVASTPDDSESSRRHSLVRVVSVVALAPLRSWLVDILHHYSRDLPPMGRADHLRLVLHPCLPLYPQLCRHLPPSRRRGSPSYRSPS